MVARYIYEEKYSSLSPNVFEAISFATSASFEPRLCADHGPTVSQEVCGYIVWHRNERCTPRYSCIVRQYLALRQWLGVMHTTVHPSDQKEHCGPEDYDPKEHSQHCLLPRPGNSVADLFHFDLMRNILFCIICP